MKVIKLQAALEQLPKLNDEIRYKSCFQGKAFTSGLVAFRPRRKPNTKQIIHADKDVVCHVLKGRGRLRVKGRRIDLGRGMICHIPKGTPHDFVAGKTGELVLFYSLINTG
ncbi:MAG TPA: cupin domain-containing protein [Candidatus Binatia bacterium]|jgi:mannose-6-phosphate isomerase-like protein (cupin superfamily)